MKGFTASLCLLALAFGAHADIVQLNTGKTLSGRVAGYANDSFELQPTNAVPMQVPANTVTAIDFSRGVVLATVELAGQKPLAGRIWLYARGALNFEDDKGETTRISLAKISRVSFSAEPLPEKPAPPPRPKPAHPPADSPVAATDPKIEIISRGDQVDIQKHCVPGKITIVDFYADWCRPCRSVGPVLEQRVNKDADLVLRKVNIVNWDSAVSRQYGVRAVPYIQVYDRHGNKVGELTGFNSALFESYISRAR
jgi:thiol-disulfide isomerase/thioredoxin